MHQFCSNILCLKDIQQLRFKVGLSAHFQFSLLAETLSEERQEIQVRKKAQEKVREWPLKGGARALSGWSLWPSQGGACGPLRVEPVAL